MIRMLTILAAALALSVQAAIAAPFAVSSSAGESGRAEKAGERNAVFGFVMDRLASAIAGKAGHSSDDGRQHLYYKNKECEAAKTASKDETEEERAEAAEPTGPEPIYYGF